MEKNSTIEKNHEFAFFSTHLVLNVAIVLSIANTVNGGALVNKKVLYGFIFIVARPRWWHKMTNNRRSPRNTIKVLKWKMKDGLMITLLYGGFGSVGVIKGHQGRV